ncbi:MAG: cupin domain-containing protein [Candidatus Omnitrophota bacterium]|nr:cupin domain-containing protein [Candidatus Omnitrophota bacterium]
MSKMRVERIDDSEIEKRGIRSWPVWEKGVSKFDWSYGEKETCYILEGRARVMSSDGQEKIEFAQGDLVTFSEDLECRWDIIEPIKKHYRMG